MTKKHIFKNLFLIIISVSICYLGYNNTLDKKITFNKLNTSIYLDPVDTAFAVEEISGYTPILNENLGALEEQLFFSQLKNSDFVDKKLAQNAFQTEKTKLEYEYTVQVGDTVTQIAEKYNMHVATIYNRNNLTADTIENIKPGDKIIIPAYDESDSSQWLAELNDKKETERQRLLALQQEREKQNRIAASNRNVYTRENTGYRQTSTNTSGYNGYPYGWCTYYVASRRNVPSNWGNAGQWLYSAQSQGYSTGSQPAVGAILVTGESWWGHVAIVESVNGGNITISEMNYSGWGVTSSRTISVYNPVIKGYVY